MKKYLVILMILSLSAFLFAGDVEVYFNNSVTATATQADLEQLVIDFIDGASTSVDVCVYDFNLTDIADAMAAAKNRGVTVRFVTDQDNLENPHSADVFNILDNASIPYVTDTEDGSAGSGIMHNKFIIVDGAKVLMGSTNFTQSGIHGDLLGDPPQLISTGNRNVMVVITSSDLAAIYTTQFEQMYGDGPGGNQDSKFKAGKTDHSQQTITTATDEIQIDVQFTPHSKTIYDEGNGPTMLDELVNYVGTATSRLKFCQFVVSAQDVADKMETLSGVTIKGIGDPGFYSRYYSEFQDMIGASEYIHPDTPADGYEVDPYTGAENNPWANPLNEPDDMRKAGVNYADKLHHKYWIVDNSVWIGSANGSAAAAFMNDENYVIIHSQAIADEFEDEFDARWEEAAGGFWDNVEFTSGQKGAAVEIANFATKFQLRYDAGFSSVTPANNIIAARPIVDMDELAAISYVTEAVMQDIKDYIGAWYTRQGLLDNVAPADAEVCAGVSFTAEEAAAVINMCNNCDVNTLDFGLDPTLGTASLSAGEAEAVVAGGPYTTIAQIRAVTGVDDADIGHLKNGYAHAGWTPNSIEEEEEQ